MSFFDTLAGLLRGNVGNNRENFPEDILAVKDGLSRAGYFDADKAPEPHGYITRDMDKGIRDFQRDRGLRVDGYLRPGGETEREIFGLDPAPAPRDEGGRIGFGGNVSGTLEPGKAEHSGFFSSSASVHPLQEKKADRNGKDENQGTESRTPFLPPHDLNTTLMTVNKAVVFEKLKEQERVPVPRRKPLSPELEKTAQDYLNKFREGGLKQSERFFRNYLDGTGKPIKLTPQEMDDTPTFKKAIQTNQKRFEDSMTKGLADAKFRDGKFLQRIEGTPSRFKEQILSLKEGETKVLKNEDVPGGVDFWDRDIGFAEGALQGDEDQAKSTGSVKLRSNGSFRVTRKGNLVEIDGVVDNRIKDLYNFDDEDIMDKTVLEPFRRMATEGPAKPFLVHGSRLKRLRGLIEIENGTIKGSDFKWEDID